MNTQWTYEPPNNQYDHPYVRRGNTGFSLIGVSAEDARLIAAAPDLLEALQAIIRDSRHADGQPLYRYGERHYETARAAIAKATQ